jgi:DNA-binding NarL/FixJ family response regulator
MNTAYRLDWSDAAQGYVPAFDTARKDPGFLKALCAAMQAMSELGRAAHGPKAACNIVVSIDDKAQVTCSIAQPSTTAANDGAPLLSAREHEVLGYLAKGFTANEIAALLKLSTFTVRSFVRRLYEKLNVRSKAEALYEARQQRLLAD